MLNDRRAFLTGLAALGVGLNVYSDAEELGVKPDGMGASMTDLVSYVLTSRG